MLAERHALLSAVAAILCGCAHNIPDSPRASTFLGIPVLGDRSLLASLERAYAILPEEDQRYVFDNGPGRIQLVDHGSGVLHTAPPVLRLAPHTIYFSRTWLAGTLVHEACHIAYAAEGLTALDEERACLARQLPTAEKIRVPERETARITSADGSHIEVPPRALYW